MKAPTPLEALLKDRVALAVGPELRAVEEAIAAPDRLAGRADPRDGGVHRGSRRQAAPADPAADGGAARRLPWAARRPHGLRRRAAAHRDPDPRRRRRPGARSAAAARRPMRAGATTRRSWWAIISTRSPSPSWCGTATPEVLETLARATVSMTEAEVFQLERKRSGTTSEADYLRIITQKTASFMSACCRIGALLGRVEPRAGRGPHPLRARHRDRLPDQRRLARLRRRPGPPRQGHRRRSQGGQADAAADHDPRRARRRRRESASRSLLKSHALDPEQIEEIRRLVVKHDGDRLRPRARARLRAVGQGGPRAVHGLRGQGDARADRRLRRRTATASRDGAVDGADHHAHHGFRPA